MVQGANLVVYGNSFYDIAGRLMHFDLCKLYGIYIFMYVSVQERQQDFALGMQPAQVYFLT